MLSFQEKTKILKSYLTDIKDHYADSFKTDVLFYLDGLESTDDTDIRIRFLKKLHSKEEIIEWVDQLTSQIVMNYNENEEQLSDFIFYATQ